MVSGVPVSLVVVYALFRMFEYFALKNYQAVAAEGMHAGNRTALSVFGVVLLPARFGGWALLIWLAVKIGILHTIGLVVLAFLLSLVLQMTLGMLLMAILGPLAGLLFLIAVPICGIAIAFMIAAL